MVSSVSPENQSLSPVSLHAVTMSVPENPFFHSDILNRVLPGQSGAMPPVLFQEFEARVQDDDFFTINLILFSHKRNRLRNNGKTI